MKCNLDYETRSECDLKEAGAYVYARHPSTRILCAAYRIDDGPVKPWPAIADGYEAVPADLKRAMKNPRCEMHAWNAPFERLITRHVLGVNIPLERWRCSAALARARGLPNRLEDALAFLGRGGDLAVKRRGSRIMKKWSQPLPTRQGGGWASDINEFYELLAYCVGDVTSESGIADMLEPLTPAELADWQITERINDTGLPIDVSFALAAQEYGAAEKAEINHHLTRLTKGVVRAATQHRELKEYLRISLGNEVFEQFFVKPTRKKVNGAVTVEDKESTDKRARADFLNSKARNSIDPAVVEVIDYVDDAGKSSVAKYTKMAARAADTGRAEGAYQYAGAIQTKRFSSIGMQMHNLPRETPSDPEMLMGLVTAHAITSDDAPVMHILASLLRPTIKAPEGRTLIWGDWSAVEARGMPWLAGCQWKLDMYRKGVDVYRVNAEHIFGVPAAEATDHQRQIGKVAELSLQFGGAEGALKSMARNYSISLTDDEAERIKRRWRTANPWAAEFSNGLFDAFMMTALGIDTSHGPISYRQIRPQLSGTVSIACDLPDGTVLYYHGVKGNVCVRLRGKLLELAVNPDIERDSVSGVIDRWETAVTYEKTLPSSHYTERLWHGLLAENVTQGLCAALLRDCLARTEQALKRAKLDAFLIGHTHDELVLESAGGAVAPRAAKVLETEMKHVPEWLTGFPLGCEVKTGSRYAK